MRRSHRRLLVSLMLACLAFSTALQAAQRCGARFDVREPGAGRERIRGGLELTACAGTCTASIRLCTVADTCPVPVRAPTIRPTHHLTWSVTPADPGCTAWARVEVPLRSGRIELAGRTRSRRLRLRVVCRPATSACHPASEGDRDEDPPADATYDVRLFQGADTTVGRASVDRRHHITISAHEDALSFITLDGQFTSDGLADVAGEHVSGGDAVSHVSGRVTYAMGADGSQQLRGTLSGAYPYELVMTRTAGGTPAALGGQHRLILESTESHETELLLPLETPPSGIILTPATAERDTTTGAVARIGEGTCELSPGGYLWCALPYEDESVARTLWLYGTLGRAWPAVFEGQFYVGLPPLIERAGIWRDATSGP
jgi:hypothetical protein